MSLLNSQKKGSPLSWQEIISKRDLIICVLILIPFLILSYIFFPVDNKPAFWEQHSDFDRIIVDGLHSHIPKIFSHVFTILYVATDAKVTAFVVAGSLGFFIWKKYWKEAAVFSFGSLGVLLMNNFIVKPFFFRLRPPDWLVHVNGRSFPSGHAAGNFFLYFYLAYILAYYYPVYTKYFYAVAITIVFSIGISCIYVRVHWFTDIVAGYGFAFVWLTLSLALLRLYDPKYLGFKPFKSKKYNSL